MLAQGKLKGCFFVVIPMAKQHVSHNNFSCYITDTFYARVSTLSLLVQNNINQQSIVKLMHHCKR